MSDQGYTPTAQEFVEAWIQAHQVPVGSGGWVDRGSAPRERIAEAHRGIAEMRREAAEKAWDEGVATALNHAKRNPDGITLRLEKFNGDAWPHPYRKGATA